MVGVLGERGGGRRRGEVVEAGVGGLERRGAGVGLGEGARASAAAVGPAAGGVCRWPVAAGTSPALP